MNTSSRFSVLSPDVNLDAANRAKTGPRKDKVKKENKRKESENVKPKATKILQVNKKKKNDSSELQALAFGFGKTKGNKKKVQNEPGVEKEKEKLVCTAIKTKSSHSTNSNGKAQDEDWRKRDEEFIKVQNENSLREAILQSKLEFEAKKKDENVNDKNIESMDAAAGSTKSAKNSKNKKKKEKPITISLDQFNNMETKELQNLKSSNKNGLSIEKHKEVTNPAQDEKFFKDVDDATRKTLEMENRHEQYKEYRNKIKSASTESHLKKLTSEIEKRDFEIQALRLEVDSLKTQLHEVKSRNKKLCEVISLSEMRSKGELVVQLEKVTKGRDEFSEDIAKLTAELEQERTKVSHLTTELKKLQGKKRTADSSSK